MSTYTVTAWDIRPNGSKKIVSTQVLAADRAAAQEAGWMRLYTTPGAYNIQVVGVEPAA